MRKLYKDPETEAVYDFALGAEIPSGFVPMVIEMIASRRWAAEVAGITVAGVPVYTDRTTQNKLTAAAFRALRNPEYTVDWKCTDGSFITLNAEQITDIADAVGDYVQACYTREGELVAAFNDGSYTEAMLEEGWPE